MASDTLTRRLRLQRVNLILEAAGTAEGWGSGVTGRRLRSFVVLGWVTLIGCVPVEAPVDVDDAWSRIERDVVPLVVVENELHVPVPLEARMIELGIPGLSLAFFDEGSVVEARAYGLADVRTGRPMTPSTLLQAASISKPVTAMALLDLVEEGALELDEDVSEVLTSWRLPEYPYEPRVTLRRLLTHTAGVTVSGYPGYGPDQEVPSITDVLSGSGNTPPSIVDLPPGSEWRYSGGGYSIVQLAISDLTGRPFGHILEERVLEPLSMRSSSFSQPLAQADTGLAATGHRASGEVVAGRFRTYPELAAAGLWTTPSDLARWAISLQPASSSGGPRVLNSRSVSEMLTPDTIGEMGLGVALYHDGQYFGHTGSNEGFRSSLTAQVTGRQGLVVMVNSDAGGRLAAEILLTVAREYGWAEYQPTVKRVVPVDSLQLARVVGSYSAGPNRVVEIVSDGKDLILTRGWDGGLVRLAAESEWAFFSRGDGQPITFEPTGAGEQWSPAFTSASGTRYARLAGS